MSLTVESLRIFCDVVKKKSFSRGAEANGVSQSAASQTVSHIEKRLGLRLIDRSTRPLTLTEKGRDFFDECRDLVERYFALEARLKQEYEEAMGTVYVASIYSVGLYDMSRYSDIFQKIYPEARVKVEYVHPDEVYEEVLSGSADLGLISFPRQMPELESLLWRRERMVLVCTPSHRLARLPRQGRSVFDWSPTTSTLPRNGKKKASIDEISGENFVAFDSDLDIRRYVDQSLENKSVQVNIVMEFDNIEAIKRAVEVGAGISILPAPTVKREVRNGSLVALDLDGLDLARPLCIIHRHQRQMKPVVTAYAELLRNDGRIDPAEQVQGRVKPEREPAMILKNGGAE